MPAYHKRSGLEQTFPVLYFLWLRSLGMAQGGCLLGVSHRLHSGCWWGCVPFGAWSCLPSSLGCRCDPVPCGAAPRSRSLLAVHSQFLRLPQCLALWPSPNSAAYSFQASRGVSPGRPSLSFQGFHLINSGPQRRLIFLMNSEPTNLGS